ncbi:MAG: right-handed parallel beta-helix repeat-containing protein, partial [Bacteroidota bacterium]
YLFRPLGQDRYAECGDPETPGYFRLSGIDFRHAANRAQWGAVCAGSRGSLVEDVTVEWTNGQGIDGSGEGHVFRRTSADHNGQMGWGASCRGCLWEDTAARGIYCKGYDMFWEAGGGKWSETSGTILRRHTAVDNGGPGIWFDIDNADNTIEGCVARGNEAAGVMLELRTVRTLVQHCEIDGTRWRDWTGTGILSQAANRNVLLHNTVRGSEGSGLWLRLDPLRRAPDGDTWVVANVFSGNVTDRTVEAREVSTEGLSPDHVRSYRFVQNAIRAWASGGTGDRSVFFVHPTDEGDYRGNSLRTWRRWVRDEGTVLASDTRIRVDPVALPRAGAPEAPARWAETAGAHPREVGL